MSRTVEIFPANLWCQAIPQAERQFLLLQQYNVNPKISTYADVYMPHDCNASPFVPIGIDTRMHDKKKIRVTFAEHFRKGFF